MTKNLPVDSYSLPFKDATIEKAVSFKDNLLAMTNKGTYCWSLADGWTKVDGDWDDEVVMRPRPEGIITVHPSKREMRWWTPSVKDDWFWKVPLSGLNLDDFELYNTKHYIVLIAEDSYIATDVQLFEFSKPSPRLLKKQRIEEMPEVVAVQQLPFKMNIISKGGACTIEYPFDHNEFEIEPSDYWDGDQYGYVGGKAFVSDTHVVFDSINDLAIHLDLNSLTFSPLQLAGVGGCQLLWDYYFNDDRESVDRAIRALERIPEDDEPFLDWTIHHLWECGDGFLVATNLGILFLDPEESIDKKERKDLPEEALFWKFWLDPEGTTPAIIELVTGFIINYQGFLQTLWDHYGISVFDHFRAYFKENDFGFPSGNSMQHLYTISHPDCLPIIEQQLKDDLPAVNQMALYGMAATDGFEETPVLWDEMPQQIEELLKPFLLSDSREIFSAAVEAASIYRLQSAFPALKRALASSEESIRDSAAQGLAKFEELSEEMEKLLEKAALSDPSDNVRLEAMRSVESIFNNRKALRIALEALKDIDAFVSNSAGDIISREFKHHSDDDINYIFDNAALNAIACRVKDEESYFTDNYYSILKDTLMNLAEDQGVSLLSELDISANAAAGKALEMMLYLIIDDIAAKGSILTGMEDHELEDLEALIRKQMSIDNLELIEQARDDYGVSQYTFFEFIMQVHDRYPDTGARLALLAILTKEPQPGRKSSFAEAGDSETLAAFQRYTESLGGGRQPLHERLDAMNKQQNPYERCRAIVESMAQEDSLAGVAATLVMAAQEKGNYLDGLIRLVKENAIHEAHYLLPVLKEMMISQDTDATKVFGELLTNKSYPFHIRYQIYDDWYPGEGEFTLEIKKKFFDEVFNHPQVSLDTKHSVARDLYALDVPELLSRFVKEEQFAAYYKTNEKDKTYDQAAFGDEESLDGFRQIWPKGGSLFALDILKRHGTREDIPVIEAAIEENGLPETGGRESIRAIEERHGGK